MHMLMILIYVMDFGNIESERSSSNFFNVVRIRDSGLSQDAQYRPRKSPHKRLKETRTSALMIEELKSIFWCPSDFISRIRTRRNWRPEFLMKYLRDSQCGCNEGCNMILRHDKRNFVPEAPKIYSIGLQFGARSLSDSDDLSYGAISNLKKRFSIVRRPMIICKYWVAQSTPTSNSSTDVSLKAHIDRQTMIIDCTESTEIISKHNQAERNNHNSHSQSHEHIEEKESVISDTLRNDRAAGDHSFISDDFKEPSVRKDHNCSSSCLTRDAESQTLSRKRRRRTKKRSKPATERKHCNNSRRKHCNNESRIIADFCTDSHSLSRRNYHDEPWLCVRVLESKRAEYINKFTAVNRQIEEITATLRETCCGGENSRNNLKNYDEYFSSISDDAKVNTVKWSGVDNRSTTAKRRNTSEEKDDLVNVERIIGKSESDRSKNMREIFHIDNLNNETVSCPKDTIASSRNPKNISNDAFGRDSVRAFTIKEAIYSSNRISKNRTMAKCRFVKQMSFDLDLTKNGDDKLQEFSIENESFDEDCLENDFAVASNNEHARNLAESLADLEESRYCKKIVEEKMGEVAILEDIKKRIDRDFDDPVAERSENDTEDFFTVSQKSSNLDRRDVINVTSVTTIEESKSMPLIESTNLKPTEVQIHDSMSIGAMSEYSNKNSTLSKYFSCTQIPSLISLTENENENEFAVEDRNIISHNSHSNLYSNSLYYDYSRSNLSLNNCSLSNLDSSFDRSRSNLEYIARYDPSAQCTSSNKFLIETVNEPNNIFEIFEDREGFAENKIYELERPPLGESKGEGKKSRVEPEKRYTTDSTFETSKSSKYVGSIDSGVFSSSLIDLYPAESSFNASRLEFKKKRRAGKLDGSSAVIDSDSDSSCTDDTLDRKVNDVVRDLTKNLILCERRAKMKLKARDAHHPRHIMSRACKFSRSLYDTCCDFFNSPRQFSKDERIISISTPSLLSLSDSEIEDRELRHQHVFR